jgi:hypothetical protein
MLGEGPDRPTPPVTCRVSELERPQCNCPALGPFPLATWKSPGPKCRDLTAGVPDVLKPLFNRLDARINLAAKAGSPCSSAGSTHAAPSRAALDLERCSEPDIHRRLRFSVLDQPGQIPVFSQSCPDHHQQVYLRPRAVTIRSWHRVHQRSRWRHCPSHAGVPAPVCLFQQQLGRD